MSRPPRAIGPARVIVPLDGGPGAERALGPARELAERIGAELRVISVAPTTREAQNRLGDLRAVTTSSEAGAGASVAVLTGKSIAASLAEEATHDLLCMTTHASLHDVESYVGSVTEEVLRRTSCPVLVVGPNVPVASGFDVRRVDVGVTHDDEWLAALPVALGFAELLDVPVRLVHVTAPGGEPPVWLGWSDACPSVGGHVVIESDDPASALAEHADDHALLVVATAGRRGLERLAEGSVALEAVAVAGRPVLIVCQPSGQAAEEGTSR